jgi:membrane protease YdiL (CAAX protease family)
MALIPVAWFGLAAEQVIRTVQRWPVPARIACPALCVLPYLAVSVSQHVFHWKWFALYAGLPVGLTWLLERAVVSDPHQRGNWRDASALLVLGLAVDLRWFEGAWPPGLQALGKLLLVDMGLYGFLAIRRLSGTGFDFHVKWSDLKTGFSELIFLTPALLILGPALDFIHPHANVPAVATAALTWIGIFFFIAVPEELYFRAWVQNLLERRLGRRAALIIASVLFGLSHFNKRSAHFNWRYVLLATIAGVFYGRSWRKNRRVSASSITHASVDWIWSWWF